MNEATNDLCRCNPCAGPQCDCGCQQKAATRESSAGTACACGPQCGSDCGCGNAYHA